LSSEEKQKGTRDHRTDCNLFGTGFSWDELQCRRCDRIEACKAKSDRENYQIKNKVQPKIPINTQPKWPKPSPFLRASRPKVIADEIVINIRFKKEWLRKIMRNEREKKANVNFIFNIRKLIRRQFANRPEIIAELDELLGGF